MPVGFISQVISYTHPRISEEAHLHSDVLELSTVEHGQREASNIGGEPVHSEDAVNQVEE